MSLKDRIINDRSRVFMQMNHYASVHTWNGIPFCCMVDDDEAVRRKNSNVNDIAWDNEHTETFIYVLEEEWPGRKVQGDQGWFDNRTYKIEQIHTNGGILGILLVSITSRPLGAGMDGGDGE